MKGYMQFIAFVPILFLLGTSAKYPEDLPKCKAGDQECLPNAINTILRKTHNGHHGLNIVAFDPLRIKTFIIEQDPNSPVNIKLTFSNVDLTGLSNADVYKTVGFEKDPKNSSFEIYAKLSTFSFIGQYEVKGNVLILPIIGTGNSNLTFDNVDVSLKFMPNAVEVRDGNEYLNLRKVVVRFSTTRMHFDLDNLFNGDKALTENMNLFLNENWESIFKEVRQAIFDAIGEVFLQVISATFKKHPYETLFLIDDVNHEMSKI